MKFLILPIFWFIFITIKCSSGDDEASSAASSDDESTVNSGAFSDTEITRAFNDISMNEQVSEHERQHHLRQQITSPNGARPLSCIDGNGQEVDWWFLYKQPGGTEYLYYSSLDVQNGRNAFLPLNSDFLIDDILTSPVLKTIYHPNNLAPSSEVWLGWNDQPDNEDENVEQRDAYNKPVSGIKHAHSKGFYAQNAVPNGNSHVTIGSYALMTSLPRFPKILSSGRGRFGDALKDALPTNPKDLFDSNLAAKAQHFFCMSLPRETVQLEVTAGLSREVPINFNYPHVAFLHKYLKTMHPAVMGTNFSDHNPEHGLWRRYFSLLKVPQVVANNLIENANLNVKLTAFSVPNLPSLKRDPVPEHLQHIFPLTWTRFYMTAKGVALWNKDDYFYRWEAKFSNQNGCREGREAGCIASFKTQTTSLQSQIKLKFFAKHGLVHMDLYDDWAALQLVESQRSLSNHYTGNVVDRFGLLVQSWIDSRGELPRIPDKKIFDEDGRLVATVHIDNVSHLQAPLVNNKRMRIKTDHQDHSKWALGLALETLNNETDLNQGLSSFVPSVFVCDLNRATSQAQLKGAKQGRGGGAVVTQSANLWRALMKLRPRAGKDRFANSSKSRAKALQTRLQPHTGPLHSPISIPLDPVRKAVFKSLRLSKKEGKAPATKSVDFVPVLDELAKFIKMAENRPEHVAMFAFQDMFQAFAHGQVQGQAEKSFIRTGKQCEKEESKYSCAEEWPEIASLPSFHLHRKIPFLTGEDYSDDEHLKRIELDAITPFIVKNEKGNLVRVQNCKSNEIDFDNIPIPSDPIYAEAEIDFDNIPVPKDTGSNDDNNRDNRDNIDNGDVESLTHEDLFNFIDSLNRCAKPKHSKLRQEYVPEYYEEYDEDSDYSNREIDYDDESFDEDESFFERASDSSDSSNTDYNSSDSRSSTDSSDSEDRETEHLDHYRRHYRELYEDSEFNGDSD